MEEIILSDSDDSIAIVKPIKKNRSSSKTITTTDSKNSLPGDKKKTNKKGSKSSVLSVTDTQEKAKVTGKGKQQKTETTKKRKGQSIEPKLDSTSKSLPISSNTKKLKTQTKSVKSKTQTKTLASPRESSIANQGNLPQPMTINYYNPSHTYQGNFSNQLQQDHHNYNNIQPTSVYQPSYSQSFTQNQPQNYHPNYIQPSIQNQPSYIQPPMHNQPNYIQPSMHNEALYQPTYSNLYDPNNPSVPNPSMNYHGYSEVPNQSLYEGSNQYPSQGINTLLNYF